VRQGLLPATLPTGYVLGSVRSKRDSYFDEDVVGREQARVNVYQYLVENKLLEAIAAGRKITHFSTICSSLGVKLNVASLQAELPALKLESQSLEKKRSVGA